MKFVISSMIMDQDIVEDIMLEIIKLIVLTEKDLLENRKEIIKLMQKLASIELHNLYKQNILLKDLSEILSSHEDQVILLTRIFDISPPSFIEYYIPWIIQNMKPDKQVSKIIIIILININGNLNF